jgi:coenzyme F420 hydrogenase subunit beta
VNGPESPTVARVLRGQLCTGCGLCASLSGGEIEMTTVAPGYARPSRPGPLSPPESEAQRPQPVQSWPRREWA